MIALALAAPAAGQMTVSSLVLPAVTDSIQYATPATGGTVVVLASASALVIDTGTLATLTITLPANPADGQRVAISAGGTITVLTINGGTVKGTVTTLVANGFARFIYSATANAWFRAG